MSLDGSSLGATQGAEHLPAVHTRCVGMVGGEHAETETVRTGEHAVTGRLLLLQQLRVQFSWGQYLRSRDARPGVCLCPAQLAVCVLTRHTFGVPLDGLLLGLVSPTMRAAVAEGDRELGVVAESLEGASVGLLAADLVRARQLYAALRLLVLDEPIASYDRYVPLQALLARYRAATMELCLGRGVVDVLVAEHAAS